MSCPISTMGATGPTARSTSSFYEFRARSLDPVAPGLRFLWGCNAANPLIARKWRYGFPCSECRWDRNKGSSQIRRHSMHHTGGDFFLDHKVNVAIPRHPRPPDSPKAGAGLAAGHRSPAVKLNLACFKFSARNRPPAGRGFRGGPGPHPGRGDRRPTPGPPAALQLPDRGRGGLFHETGGLSVASATGEAYTGAQTSPWISERA